MITRDEICRTFPWQVPIMDRTLALGTSMSTTALMASSWPSCNFLCMKRLRRMPSAAARIAAFSIMGLLGGRASLVKKETAALLHARPSVGTGEIGLTLTGLVYGATHRVPCATVRSTIISYMRR